MGHAKNSRKGEKQGKHLSAVLQKLDFILGNERSRMGYKQEKNFNKIVFWKEPREHGKFLGPIVKAMCLWANAYILRTRPCLLNKKEWIGVFSIPHRYSRVCGMQSQCAEVGAQEAKGSETHRLYVAPFLLPPQNVPLDQSLNYSEKLS